MKVYIINTLFLFLFIGCESYNDKGDQTPSFIGDIVDKVAWYADDRNEVIDINISIPIPNKSLCAPYTNPLGALRACTLEDIDNDIDAYDDYKPELYVRLSARDYPSSSEQENALFYQKGKSTRNARLKSYRIKLDKAAPLIYSERYLQLNKHPFDKSKVRNRLFFSLFEEIPNFVSFKTRFCRLYINNEDYGLYTHIERADENFLRNRGWNEDDYIYKAQNFDFRIQAGMELDKNGKPINKSAFETVIEPATGKDYSKLIEMLHAINRDMSDAAFTQVFDKYFNRKNYLTWMAVNIIVGNKDTVSQNFFLFNPKYTNTFYFLPWDYDDTALDTVEYAKWELGIATWWGIPLHKKFLRIKKNRDDLDLMINEIRNKYITSEKIQDKLDKYKILVEPFIQRVPDSTIVSQPEWQGELDSLVSRIDENVNNYKKELGVPMPYWQSYKYENEILTLLWDESIDFEGDALVYDVQLADNPDFNNSLIGEFGLSIENGDLNVTSWGEVSYSRSLSLNSGDRLFMKITAKERDNPVNYQIAFDQVELNDVKYFGVLEFVIE